MRNGPEISSVSFSTRVLNSLLGAISLVVFGFLDLLDFILCYVYRFLDEFLEENPTQCYCCKNGGQEGSSDGEGEEEMSETLRDRKIFFRENGFLGLKSRNYREKKRGKLKNHRWSDCSCESCVSWQEKGEERLHLVTNVPINGTNESVENAIFIHGFLTSSSFWSESIFPQISNPNFRTFAIDLLGFGQSPKPANCQYRLNDHVKWIEKSVIESHKLDSFHIVAHSMGCMIALALAAKYPNRVKSITLVAPPYFSSSEVRASHNALMKLAERRIWPPLLFGSAVMSWYEHIGRTVCFIFCKNHLIWERIIKLIFNKRDLHFLVRDMTKHTHHSAWHTMHNVICGGAKLQDRNLEIIEKARVSMKIIHGDKDRVVPIECSYGVKSNVQSAELRIMNGKDHNTVIFGREKEFTRELEEFWVSVLAGNK
ncbi:hypothetical protein LUZ60_013195 [Juncus effusus]|nr:hypothetical protein LUZ60_013195 [Juncus effusus]